MNELTIFDHLVDIDEREKNAIRGTLRCSCGNDYFKIYYYGKRTRGILSPDIIRLNKRIVVLAHCELCDKAYGFDNYNLYKIQFNEQSKITQDLIAYDDEKHKIRFSFNYFPEKFKSNDFEDLIVEIFQRNKKWRVIVEE
ncbi:hypothetical protein [Liberiplasma polymorphum]|uniref:hypothetical protein n=1 Tax=Liberiplasma polymorphum TaxID=3374570 RepID=UPI00377587AF